MPRPLAGMRAHLARSPVLQILVLIVITVAVLLVGEYLGLIPG